MGGTMAGDETGRRGGTLLDRAPGWVFHGALTAVLLVALYDQSAPVGVLFSSVLLFLGILVLGATWVVRAGFYLARRTRTGSAWSFLVAPALGGIFLLSIGANLPLRLRLRFGASRDAFATYVSQPHDRPTYDAPQRVGFFDVREVQTRGTDQWLTTSSGGFFATGGFAYLPEGLHGDRTWYHMTHIDGPWWAWTYSH